MSKKEKESKKFMSPDDYKRLVVERNAFIYKGYKVAVKERKGSKYLREISKEMGMQENSLRCIMSNYEKRERQNEISSAT
jgi:hypothetical protein